MPPHLSPCRITAALLTLTIAASPHARPQSEDSPENKPGAQPNTNPNGQTTAPVPLTTPLTLDAIGLTILLPDSVTTETNSIPGGRTNLAITPTSNQPDDGRPVVHDWFINVYNLQSNDRTLTPSEALDTFLRQRKAALERKQNDLLILHRNRLQQPLRIGPNQLPAARAYVTTPTTNRTITGYTVAQTSPGSFIVFQLTTGNLAFDDNANPPFNNQHINIYESISASASYEDPQRTRLETRNRFQAGANLLAQFDAEDIRDAIERLKQPTFIRLHRPAPTGSPDDATEIAFQRIEYRVGQLGELERDTPKQQWTTKQREFGFIVDVKARTHTAGIIADSHATYFLSTDLEEEYWTTTTVTKPTSNNAAAQRSVARETLIRRGRAITVSIDETATPPWTRDWNVPKTDDNRPLYIPRVTLYLLPHLVADHFNDAPTAIECSFYAYDSSLRRLSTRTDSFDNLERDGWLHTSSPAPDRPDIVTSRDEHGRLVKRTLPSHIIATPTSRERLVNIWLRKGLDFSAR